MAEISGENGTNGVYEGFEIGNINTERTVENAGTISGVYGGVQANGMEKAVVGGNNLPAKAGLWAKFKGFWLQEIDWTKEIKVELTPYQQKVEDEINDFLHQEITWEKAHDFLFQEITFGKK